MSGAIVQPARGDGEPGETKEMVKQVITTATGSSGVRGALQVRIIKALSDVRYSFTTRKEDAWSLVALGWGGTSRIGIRITTGRRFNLESHVDILTVVNNIALFGLSRSLLMLLAIQAWGRPPPLRHRLVRITRLIDEGSHRLSNRPSYSEHCPSNRRSDRAWDRWP